MEEAVRTSLDSGHSAPLRTPPSPSIGDSPGRSCRRFSQDSSDFEPPNTLKFPDSAPCSPPNNQDYPISRTVDPAASVMPPVAHAPKNEAAGKSSDPSLTCSLHLMCYRAGTQGGVMGKVRVTAAYLYPNDATFQQALANDKNLYHDDRNFFLAIRNEYNRKMCGFARRWLSLKTLRQIRLLSYTKSQKPQVVQLDDLTLNELLHIYKNPSDIKTEDAWVDWVFRLRQNDRRHALELIEGWSGTRIAVLGSVPWVAATVVGIVWVTQWGDAQTAFTVAGFILTVGTSLLALLAIVSKIES